MKRALCVFGFAGLMWLILAVMGAGFPLPFQHNFFTVNTAPVVQTTAGSNCFVTFTQAGQTRTYLIDVPTNGPAGASFGLIQGTNVVLFTNGTVVTIQVPAQTNGFGNTVYSNANAFDTNGAWLGLLGGNNLWTNYNEWTTGAQFDGNFAATNNAYFGGKLKVGSTGSINSTNQMEVDTTAGAKAFQIGTNGVLYGNGTGLTNLNAANLTGSGTNNTTGSAGSLTGGATNQVYAYGSAAGWTGNVGVSNVTMSGNIVFSKDVNYLIGSSASSGRPSTVFTLDIQASRDVYVGVSAGSGSLWIGQRAQLTSPNANELQIHNAYGAATYARVIVSNLISTDLTISTNGFSSYRSNAVSSAAITFPATTANWTNTQGINIVLYVDNFGITGTTISKNGQQIFSGLANDCTLFLKPGDYFSEVYSVGTPTARWEPQ